MTQAERIEILLASIEANMQLGEEKRELMRKALIEGQIKIVQIEEAYRRAMEPYYYFPVELVKEGFAFWNTGGYSREKRRGKAIVAAGHDLEALKVIRTMKEPNGRHTLCIVYQGCYLVEFEVFANGNEIYRVYQIVSLVGRDNGCEAKCQCLVTSAPKLHEARMGQEEERRFGPLIEVAGCTAMAKDNISTAYRVK